MNKNKVFVRQTTNILRLANTVRQNIQIEKLINSNNLLITFSGGQDSAFCLLVLYLLNNLEKKWNCKKVLDLSNHYSKNNTLIKQTFNSNLSLSTCRHGKQSIFYLSQTKALLCKTSFCNQKISVTSLYHNSNANFLTFNDKLTKQSFSFSKRKANVKKNKLISNQVTPLIDSYTLLWCNHFWQKDTFFTMEHVFKLSFSKNYTMHSFAPVKKILSEQNARHWRHKVMQRLSLFLLKRNSHFVELYFNHVFITTPFLFTRSKKQNNGLCFLSNKNEFIQPSSLTNRRFVKPELYSLQKHNFCEDIANVKSKLFASRTQNFVLQSFDHNSLDRLIFNQNVIAEENNTKNNLKKALLPGFDRSVAKQSSQARVEKKRSFFYGEPMAPSLSEQLCIQGHNKSDRAEAILFNLMRGTGMNGLSTLQWKHTFFPPSNSNFKFYPIFSDFFKEIQIIYLNSLFMKIRLVFAKRTKAKKNFCKTSSLKKETIFRSTFNKNFFFVQPAKIVPKNRNEIIQPKKRIANSNQSKLMLLSKNFMVSAEQSYNDRLNFVMQNEGVRLVPSQKTFFFYYQLKYQKNI